MLPVESSRLAAIGYEPYSDNSGNGNLQVKFPDGDAGFYSQVPLDVFQQFRDSPSKGKFLSVYIIPYYQFTKTG